MSDGEPKQGPRLSRESPWPGLRAFLEEDSEFFFGREKETVALVDLVQRSPVVVLHGQSGLGKTSLVQAGLFPALRKLDFLCLRLRLDFDKGEPLARQISAALASELDREGIAGPRPGPEESLWHYFHRRDVDFWGPRNRLLTPVIVLDQFEEIFTLGQRSESAAARAAAFAAELEALIEHRAPDSVIAELEANPDGALRYDLRRESVKFVFSLREDFLPHLRTWRHRIPSLLEQEFRLERMSGSQALDVVRRSGGDLVEAGVERSIVDFVSTSQRLRSGARRLEDREVEPALLCVVCEELNLRRGKNPTITADLLTGEQQDIIGGFYERAFVGVNQAVRDWLEERLLTATGYRQRAALEDALQLGLPVAEFDLLVDRRVLHREERDGVVWLELTHDLLSDPAARSRSVREQRRQAESTRRKLRRFRVAAASLSLLVVAALFATYSAVKEAMRAKAAQAETAQEKLHADDAAKRAESQTTIAVAAQAETAQEKQQAVEEAERAESQTKIAVAAQAETAQEKQQVVDQLVANYTESGRAYLQADEPENAAVELNAAFQLGGKGDAMRLELRRALTELDCDATLLQGHTGGAVNFAEFSPDGRRVVTAGADGTAKVWSTETGQLLANLAHGISLSFARFSPDGRYLATAGVDFFVRLWNVKGFTSTTLKVSAGDIRSLQFSPAAGAPKMLVLSGAGEVLLWDLKGIPSSIAVPQDMRENITAVSFDSSGQFVAAVRRSGGVWIWECDRPADEVRQLVQPKSGVELTAVGFMEGNQRLAVGDSSGRVQLCSIEGKSLGDVDRDGEGAPIIGCEYNAALDLGLAFSAKHLSVWDSITGKSRFEISAGDGDFSAARFDPTGAYIVTVGSGGWIRFHDSANGLLLRKIRAAAPGQRTPPELLAESFSADGAYLVTAGEDSLARVWRISDCHLPVTLRGHRDALNAATFSPDGSKILTASRDQTARLWDAANGRPIGQPMQDAKGWVLQAAFSPSDPAAPDGYVLTTGFESSLWNAKDGTFVRRLGDPADLASADKAALCGAFSTDGHFAIVGSRDGHWTKWNVATGEAALRSPDNVNKIVSLAYSPQTDSLLTTGDGSATLWRGAFGTIQLWYATSGVQVAVFDPSGVHVAVGLNSGRIDVRELGSLASRTLKGHSARILSLAFSRDGKYLLSGGADGMARIWGFNSGKLLSTLPGKQGPVASVAFSPRGEIVATGDSGGYARIWDGRSGRLLDELHGHAGAITELSFSPDGTRLLTASMDGSAKVWDLSPDERSAGEIGALVNSRIPAHLDGGEPVDGSLTNSSMAYDLAGGSLSESMPAEQLRQAGGWVDRARLAYLEGDGPEALTLLRRAVNAKADWPAVRAIAWQLSFDMQGLEKTIRLGPSRINSLAYNKSGDKVLVASLGGTGWIVEPATGRVVSLTGHHDWVFAGAFSLDGSLAATSSKDWTVRTWDAASGQERRVLQQNTQPYFIRFSPDNRYLAANEKDGTIELWDPATGKQIQILTASTGAEPIFHLFPDGSHLAAGSQDGLVRIWQVPGNAAPLVIKASKDGKPINDLDISADGLLLATAGSDNLLQVWDSQTGKPKFAQDLTVPVDQVVFGKDQAVMTVSDSNLLSAWDAGTGRLLRQARYTGGPVDYVILNSAGDSELALSGSSAVVWNVKTGQFAGSIGALGGLSVRSDFHPDGRHVALAAGSLLTLWSTENLRTRGRLINLEGRILWSGLSSARTFRVLSLQAKKLQLLEPLGDDAGGLQIVLPEATEDVVSAAVSANGTKLLIVDSKGTASIGDFSSGHWQRLAEAARPAIGISADGNEALTLVADGAGDEPVVLLWDCSSGRLVRRFEGTHNDAIHSLQFSPDGRQFVTASADRTAKIWDAATGEQVSAMAGHSADVQNAWFSPDGRELITSGSDGGTRLWTAGTGRLLATLVEDRELIASAAFSADNRFILTGDDTGIARMWDHATGKLVARFHLHDSASRCCGFLGQGERIFSQGSKGDLRTWEIAGSSSNLPDLEELARRATPWSFGAPTNSQAER
jgi:WD40 repeat protein